MASQVFINHLLLCPLTPCTKRWTHTQAVSVFQKLKKAFRGKMPSTWWRLLEPGYASSDLPCQDNAHKATFILNRLYRKFNPGTPSSYPWVDGLASEGTWRALTAGQYGEAKAFALHEDSDILSYRIQGDDCIYFLLQAAFVFSSQVVKLQFNMSFETQHHF